jgi:hypothetical protein
MLEKCMFEKRRQPVAKMPIFLKRLLASLLLALSVLMIALLIGIIGYHHLAHLNWIDALLNAAMILGGMGPVDSLPSDEAKVFASFYALFSGVIFISTIGILLTPLFHRLMHKFHMDEVDFQESDK